MILCIFKTKCVGFIGHCKTKVGWRCRVWDLLTRSRERVGGGGTYTVHVLSVKGWKCGGGGGG
jgi:hypothetical protein